jgi:hypothetical protein
MADEMNIPEEMKEKIFEIIMAKVPPEKMEEALEFLIKRFNEQKSDKDAYATVLGVLYGILGYGYYLGGYDAVESMVEVLKIPIPIDRKN